MHPLTQENVDELSSLSMAISKLAQSQESCQKQLLDSFNNMAHTSQIIIKLEASLMERVPVVNLMQEGVGITIIHHMI